MLCIKLNKLKKAIVEKSNIYQTKENDFLKQSNSLRRQ